MNVLGPEGAAVANFGWALADLQNGRSVSRQGWNGKNQFLTLQVPDEDAKMTLPYIYLTTTTGDRVPWLASQTDLLAHDWFIFEARNQEPDVIAGAMGPALEESPDYPTNLLPQVSDKASRAIENIQTLLAETEGCGGKCMCNKRYL